MASRTPPAASAAVRATPFGSWSGHRLEPLHSTFRTADTELLQRSCQLDCGAFIRATGWRLRPTFARDDAELTGKI